MKNALPPLTVVLGGAASGKTAWAEGLATGAHPSPIYVATGQAFDAEMAEKIKRHQALRGDGWQTIECPMDLTDVLKSETHDGDVVVIDCLTLWLTNLMLADRDIETECAELLIALNGTSSSCIVITNEVGHGIVPTDAMARSFRNHQGKLNQVMAAQADLVVQVIAGLPLVLKGELPR